MPRLWTTTVDAHRRAVREAILDTAAALVADHGLRSVTMSQIAETAGIGRATLYKYFADVEAVLRAWHERQINRHLDELTRVRDQSGDARARLEAVLETYALINHNTHRHADVELASVLHRDVRVAQAGRRLGDLIRELLTEAGRAGHIRTDVPPEELATYCVHSLTAASELPNRAAVRRLVGVTMAGLLTPR